MRTAIAAFSFFVLVASTSHVAAQDVQLDPSLAELHVPRDDEGARIGAQIGGTVGTLVVGAGLGALVGLAGAQDCSGPTWCFASVSVVVGALGGASLALLLSPLTVAGVGDAMGGRSDVGTAYLGLLIGAASGGATIALGVAISEAVGRGSDLYAAAQISSFVAGGLLTLAGPIVAYAVADGAARRRGPDITPSVSVSPEGASVSFAGSF